MIKSFDRIAVTELQSVQKISYQKNLWILALTSILMAGCLWCLNQTWMSFSPSLLLQSAIGIAAMFCCFAAQKLSVRTKAFLFLAGIPFLILLILTKVSGWIIGGKAWLDIIVSQWSAFYEGSMQSVSVSASNTDILAFSLLIAAGVTELLWLLVANRRITEVCLFSILILCMQLLTGHISVLGCGFMLFAIAGMILSDKDMYISAKGLIWAVLLAVCLCLSLTILPNGTMKQITTLRQEVKHAVHTFRYGEDTLPEGNLRNSAQLHQNTEEMLIVSSVQKKDLYLRGFVGGVYRDGQWRAMPKSAYKNSYSGMLSWLKKREFHPLTQASGYYLLGTEADSPESNKITVNVTGASRYYLYTPASLNSIYHLSVKDVQDSRIINRGIFGAGDYTMSEISGVKPAELMIAASWLSNPSTPEQKQYRETESVYRNFVYDSYTLTENHMQQEIQKIFWSDYTVENDSIFHAIEQIRKVLRSCLSYTESPQIAPEGTDPILWALKDSHEANAMIYASAAVQALRTHGIPARYVEGYYLSSKSFTAQTGPTLSVSGTDTHAWTEVYFDGIGWLPLDVTPGYYYDMVSLQNFISAPDKASKNAVLSDNSFEGKEIADEKESMLPSGISDFVTEYGFAGILAGILAILIILFTLFLAFLECRRILFILLEKKRYEHASPQERVVISAQFIYFILALWNIDAKLGWKTAETDQKITDTFPDVHPGEYSRVCEILEKSIYGEKNLELYETRTVQIFLQKLYRQNRMFSLLQRLKLRYANTLCGKRLAGLTQGYK